MSDIKWCDFGGHPFSTNDPEAKSLSSLKDGTQEREFYDICGPCKADGKLNIKTLGESMRPTRAEIDHEAATE